MLVTACDIVTRLPDADDARVRLELSGNLCRCTGYVGIVRAIRRVLDARRAVQVVPLDTAVRLELSASEQAWK
jgi:carbon-monoxide dehydrogenase small subunit